MNTLGNLLKVDEVNTYIELDYDKQNGNTIINFFYITV